MDDRIFSVSELNGYIKLLIEGDPLLDRIYVRGEISNYKMYPSGHHYFTLKDQEGKTVHVERQKERLLPRARAGQRGLAPRVPRPDHDAVILLQNRQPPHKCL